MLAAFALHAPSVPLEPWPLGAEQVVDGAPEVSGIVLHESADGRIERGIWEHTTGVSRDIESEELFVVVSGRATVEIDGGPALEIASGDVAVLPGGARTVWHVHETLRKVYQSVR